MPGLTKGVSAERVIAAAPERLFDLLADPSRHRELDGSGTVREASEGSSRLALGSVFGMQMRAGLPYSMASEVIEFETDRRIAWQTRPTIAWARRFVGGRIWRYELQPVEGGTRVRESWDITQERVPLLVAGLAPMTRRAIERSLVRLEELTAA